MLTLGFLGCASSPNRQQSYLQANEYRKEMDRQKADMAAEEKARSRVPELNAAGHEKLGDQYLSQGNIDLAFIHYQRALEMDSGRLRVRYKIGPSLPGKRTEGGSPKRSSRRLSRSTRGMRRLMKGLAGSPCGSATIRRRRRISRRRSRSIPPFGRLITSSAYSTTGKAGSRRPSRNTRRPFPSSRKRDFCSTTSGLPSCCSENGKRRRPPLSKL